MTDPEPVTDTGDKKTILIVDDEKGVLSSLRRLLRKEGWRLLLTTSARKGLELLASNRVDLVVSDMRMPGMDGATFLRQVKEDYPQTVRVILTGYAERKSVTDAFTEADIYQLISKPWDDDELKEVLRNALEQIEGQEDESEGLHRLLNEIDSLPSLPNVYVQLKQALAESDEGSLERVAEVVAQDPAIAARTLRIANSAFFGQRRQVETIQRAVSLIGLVMIENIVLAASVFSSFETEDIPGFSHTEFWSHSLACGLIARFVEEHISRDRKRMEMAMLAGTLHDLGKLVLARYYNTTYVEVVGSAQRDEAFVSEKERDLLGVTHSTLGGHLADWWNMPEPIADAIRWHENPAGSSGDRALAAVVHMADVFVHRANVGESGNGKIPDFHASLGAILEMSAQQISDLEQEVIERVEGEDFLAL